ncbi:hypothetical protein ONZ45_g2208 [Pleurotus djamor]|nr:hypothetical protein ONZ45_g2208 [Pleurotus djamor]
MRGISTSAAFAAVSLAFVPFGTAYTWPDKQIDHLEDILFVQSGFRRSGFMDAVNPCSFGFNDPAKQNAAEWVRTAFHDMITHNSVAGTGGVDGSIIFETHRPENSGAAFNSTIGFLMGFHSVRASMADLIAMGAHMALRTCGGPSLPMRFGRIDATGPGPEGVPEPQDSLPSMTSRFATAGFFAAEMIQMTACGHTLGGVHSSNFPDITTNPHAHFDTTHGQFDNRVISEYLDSTTTNPLIVGPSATRSDRKLFIADRNLTVRGMATPAAFTSTCRSILTRMIDTVPRAVTLTAPMTPIPIKPVDIQLTLNADGTLTFSGAIRIFLTGRTDQTPVVRVQYLDRLGNTPSNNVIDTTVPTFQSGIGSGFDGSFKFYQFSGTVSGSTGISSFTVSVSGGDGDELHNNGGAGFPVQDSIIFQKPQSCLVQEPDADGRWNLTIVAAVRMPFALNPSAVTIMEKIPRPGILVPALSPKRIFMRRWATAPGYLLQSATYKIVPEQWVTTFDVETVGANRVADEYKSTMLESNCAPFV